MILKRLFATYTFRFMISYVTGLSVAVFILLVITYGFYSYDYFADINNSLNNELDLLETEFSHSGIQGLEDVSRQRHVKSKYDRFSYILVDQQHNKLSGDLTHWPEYKTWSKGWLGFEMSFEDWTGEPQLYNYIARLRILQSGQRLLVARVSDDARQNIQLVGGSLFWGMIIMILLGAIGGIITSLMSYQRVESINIAIRRIMAGNLSERIDVQGDPTDDFQQLATNMNAMLDKIEDSVNDVRQVSNNIAHDLRTPLTRLRNKLSDLETRSSPKNLEIVQSMLQEADSLLSTFSALLRISQVESTNKKARFTTVNLSDVFNDVVELYEPLAALKNIDLSVQQMFDLKMQGDKDLLFQMLANIIDNAIKYTPENGDVFAELSVSGEQINIVFADSGVGIDPDKYEKVFQRFYRVEESRGLQPGNGLGLSLVLAVANLHGGEITLSNANIEPTLAYASGLKIKVIIPLS